MSITDDIGREAIESRDAGAGPGAGSERDRGGRVMRYSAYQDPDGITRIPTDQFRSLLAEQDALAEQVARYREALERVALPARFDGSRTPEQIARYYEHVARAALNETQEQER